MLLVLLRLYRAVPVGPRVETTRTVEPDAAKSDIAPEQAAREGERRGQASQDE